MTHAVRLVGLGALAALVLATPAHAVTDPNPGRYDTRIRTVAFNAMNVVRVTAGTFSSTQILFAPSEQIQQVAIGDSDARLAQPAGNLLFLKPVEARAPTNMQVVTRRADNSLRSYQFELVARVGTPERPAPDTQFAINFVYPEDARAAVIAERQRAAASAGERRAEARLAVDFFYGPRNWRYAAQGSVAIEPAEVSDNGRMTAFRFPGNMAVPTITTIAVDGQESIVPYTMRDDLAIVQTTAREFRLRLGGQVTRIVNFGYDPIGPNPRTGTTTPEILRSVRETRP